MTDPKLALMLMTHRAYSRGADSLHDADLTQMADAWPDLRQVFEELQFLRREKDRLDDALALRD